MAAKILLVGHVDVKTGLNQALYDTAQREGWLEMRAQVPRSNAQRLLEEADALLLVQPQSDVQVPGKLFEYICIGRPILALVPRASAIEHILRNSGIPHVCVYGDDERDVRIRSCWSSCGCRIRRRQPASGFGRTSTPKSRPRSWRRLSIDRQ